MLELHAYMRIPTPLIVRGSPAPATVFSPSTQSIGLSLSLGMSNGFQRSFEMYNIYSLQHLLNQYLKLKICPLEITIALTYPPGWDYLAARSGLEESFHLLHMARTVGGKQRVESCTTSYEHCLS